MRYCVLLFQTLLKTGDKYVLSGSIVMNKSTFEHCRLIGYSCMYYAIIILCSNFLRGQ